MTKRRTAIDPRQIDLFTAARPVSGVASFADANAWVASEIGLILKHDPRSREEIAGALSAISGEEISRWMLDGYASPARDTINISFARAIALMAATGDRALIEEAVHRLGGRILWGEEILTARLGHLIAQRKQLDGEIRGLERGRAQPIDRSAAT